MRVRLWGWRKMGVFTRNDETEYVKGNLRLHLADWLGPGWLGTRLWFTLLNGWLIIKDGWEEKWVGCSPVAHVSLEGGVGGEAREESRKPQARRLPRPQCGSTFPNGGSEPAPTHSVNFPEPCQLPTRTQNLVWISVHGSDLDSLTAPEQQSKVCASPLPCPLVILDGRKHISRGFLEFHHSDVAGTLLDHHR